MSKTEHTPTIPDKDEMRGDLIAEAITEAFGERCPDYDKDCWCCRAWQQYDEMLAALEHARHVMWEYGFSEDELQPIRTAISRATGQAGEG